MDGLAMTEQISRQDAIKELMREHKLPRQVAAGLVDELLRVMDEQERRPIGLTISGKEHKPCLS